jgi:hypothetical protein
MLATNIILCCNFQLKGELKRLKSKDFGLLMLQILVFEQVGIILQYSLFLKYRVNLFLGYG